MSNLAFSEIEFNTEGYLAEFADWNEDLAKSLASQESLELSDCHWRVIHFLRE